mmetsp:Transcript_34594/g.75615  ORF Transcript_34594/g.75615 Transcript_34594/m.75615 type:complete len:244 (-) Transcript_34594:229-960(-)|eukprot:CAMPEP_0118932480 /NCGR_PEP_ID=MMETSP1169-20130426/10339_1 /TAXON_ID=36882 /ORGANISM="Pyramimonas obovata, Strain CCMP722" /LENGTH=243 /DNA_ID=CAMNT_0006875145 /DNA_START=89 /DNA_END=820 /DNA_ORIENTATION=+
MYALMNKSSVAMARTVAMRKVQTVRCAAADASAKPKRKPSPLEVGGTLSGKDAAGKAAGAKAIAELKGEQYVALAGTTKFEDSRWKVIDDGYCWDFEMFKGADGETDWNAVIDAEVRRRKILEDFPEACDDNISVTFDLSMIPFKVWVTRFHLPEAEQANGRAAMIGFVAAYLVDLVFHVSIVDQMDSFLGKALLAATLIGTLAVRRNEDLELFKSLADEATFYDRQWNATWEGVERPSEKSD